MTGNLSHQIEHHLFPDIPARRYPEISVEVREICGRYGLPYNTGGLSRQLGSVAKKIVTLALPDRVRAAVRPRTEEATATAGRSVSVLSSPPPGWRRPVGVRNWRHGRLSLRPVRRCRVTGPGDGGRRCRRCWRFG